MATVKIREVILGEGIPKICVPLIGKDIEELEREAKVLNDEDFDLVEIRADFFEDIYDMAKVRNAIYRIRQILKDTPILFTFRSFREGGEQEVSDEFYFKLNTEVSKMGLIDAIDIELFNEEIKILELVKIAHENKIKVIMSNHDFYKTPKNQEIISRLLKMQQLGADVTKIAVMAKCSSDVLELLKATDEMKLKHAYRPFITIAMDGYGVISRISGEIFGSSVTFGAVKNVSAPGQLNIKELKKILRLIHEELK
ncbi:type I 3-dehydroquinate dehydratase [Clostridium botulinum]|uniref:3-dehydroquinate dehydratase n=1 Tax=Clostridium botulinum D str. 1873 TaxID=592027 RepID=A0A9P2LKN9_CLOBO|nr:MULTISPECIES: type I 3-dehydroquinate dehydratase [Clostridium]EES90637.1 3-dehydroquinate dehydratase, type I [Clostridium botulinum D str. 1873]MBO3441565.1 type I 3-dehydroquinate dehydratase [Clostridium haemolyticum]MCD3216460.1 type I 3-dehydroquinate dehydratase [Clostridium botulinum C]NFV46622.1 type I 3-dehydroquinate dehydratase [Clostridium botulinum]OOV60357.1 3-dehydroquinase [Clostridium botulinum D/C]